MADKAVLEYGQEAMDHLRKKDKKLGAAIDRIGPITRTVQKDLFCAIAECVIAQQVSAKAADTIYNRMAERLNGVTPQSAAGISVAELRQCGMSERKAGYIKGAAEAVLNGHLDGEELCSLPDEQVIERLTALKGIGVWTAEMLLIFSLGRLDVVSFGDLAIRRGMMQLYGLQELSREKFERYRKRYSPYGTVASLYLWALSGE
ncbi:MAG: DNA-3-methyladenine glycosylase family protein [Christensenellales bacterium]